MLIEWMLIALLLGVLCIQAFLRRSDLRIQWLVFALAGFALAADGAWAAYLNKQTASRAQVTTPHLGRPDKYAGSSACQACHPSQHASWHQSFHRTMTQLATPETVRGKFDNVTLELDGEMFRLQRRGNEFWIEMDDPSDKLIMTSNAGSVGTQNTAVGRKQRVQRRVSMLTGSHHMQAYWVDNGHGNQQLSFPFTYLFEQERWVPRRSVFLKDPTNLAFTQVWNVGCIECHATGGQPRPTDGADSFDSRVAEFGISCEACHGPAEEHVRLNSDPRHRYDSHFAKKDSAIVNPAKLSHKRSAEVCGACHSVHSTKDQDEWMRVGVQFKPGEELEPKVPVLRRPKTTELRVGSFWNDGMVRLSGREFNGLINTACYQKGEMSCLSCHSLHQGKPVNQVAAGMESNAACLQCHSKFTKNLEQHTHHAANSSGSLCYNCHMPYTSYGLLKGIRSHQISSPNTQTTLQTGRPNACNLCHLDRSLDWTGRNLLSWYNIRPPKSIVPDAEAGALAVVDGMRTNDIAASILWATQGDAGQRALIAWHMGWQPAREASKASQNRWIAPVLSALLEDPYAAVRYIAGRSLRRQPGFENFEYDYVASPAALHDSRLRAAVLSAKAAHPITSAALLLKSNGESDRAALDELLKLRNNRSLELLE